MVKTLLYTSNPDFVPNTTKQLYKFAEENNKMRMCYVNEDSELYNVKSGAHIVTTKGNNVYVLQVMDRMYDYEVKKSNILGILSVDYPLEKENILVVTDINNKTTKQEIKTPKTMMERMKAMFMPTEATDLRIATDGNICVETEQGFVSINADNELVSYPQELTLQLPVFVICKPKEQVAVGDILQVNKSYIKVTGLDEKSGKIFGISYTGYGRSVMPIKDFLFNQTMVRVVVSLAGNLNGQMNPMMLMLMSKEEGSDNLLPLMMMSQNQGQMQVNNPMMMMMLMGEDKMSIKDMLLMSMMNGGNLFGNK